MKLDILAKAANAAKVAAFRLKEVRPEIMLGLGAVSVLAGTILACKKTKEAEPIIEQAVSEFEELDHIKSNPYAEERPGFKEYARVCVRHGCELAKVYALPTVLWVGGMSSIIGSHGEMRSRNARLLSNSVALKQLFDAYRERVREQLGEEAERDLYFGAEESDVTVVSTDPKTGEKKVTKKKGKIFRHPQPGSMWARNFTPRTTDEYDVRSYNEFFIEQVEKSLNADLKMVPFITINEVYDKLNMKPGEGKCAEGMTVGWVWNPKIDRGDREIKIEMLEGWEELYDEVLGRVVVQPCLRLDFNCYPLEGLV